MNLLNNKLTIASSVLGRAPRAVGPCRRDIHYREWKRTQKLKLSNLRTMFPPLSCGGNMAVASRNTGAGTDFDRPIIADPPIQF